MWAGVLKSGSPRLKSNTVLPSALSCRALAPAASVADCCTAAAILETGNMRLLKIICIWALARYCMAKSPARICVSDTDSHLVHCTRCEPQIDCITHTHAG